MPYSIETKDGITIDNIPDNIPPDHPSLKSKVNEIRNSKTVQAKPVAGVSDNSSSPLLPPIYGGVETEPKPKSSFFDKAIGTGEAALSAITGATGGAVGLLGGITDQLGKEIMSGDFGSRQSADRVEQEALRRAGEYTYQPRTAEGQRQAKIFGDFAGKYLQPLVGLSPEIGQISSAGKMAIQKANAMRNLPELSQIKDVSTVLTDKQVPVVEAIQTARYFLTPENKKQLAIDIKLNPNNPEYVPYKLVGNTVTADIEAIRAGKQGWDSGFIQSIKNSNASDLNAYKQMLYIYKTGKENTRYQQINRPADVVGKTFAGRVDHLFDLKNNAIDKLDITANKLKGKQVNYTDAITNFENRLRDLGVTIDTNKTPIAMSGSTLGRPDIKVGDLKIWLRGSDIERDRASKGLLKSIAERLGDTDVKDGYDLHRAKRFIDTQVEYGKKSKNGLLNATASIVKDLRRDINEALRNSSPEYKAANDQYRESLLSLEAIQKSVGSSKNLKGKNVDKSLGQEARKLLSKYGNRVNMLDSITEAENILKKYGYPVKGDIINQIIFANELDHMFGDVARGSFQSKISAGIETGIETAQKAASSDAHETLYDLAKAGINKVKGVNEDNALKAIRELINKQKR